MVKFENFAIYKPEFKSGEEDEPEYRPDILYARDKMGETGMIVRLILVLTR